MAVYSPKMAPSGLKLWGNAFQMIPDISFFDDNFCWTKKSSEKMFIDSPPNLFQQSAYFVGAMIFWTSLADAPRKMTSEVLNFSSLRRLVEG